MNALDELKTILQVSEHVSDTADDSSVVCQLLTQWKSRHTQETQQQAWADVDVSTLGKRRLSVGLRWWLAMADARGELSVPLSIMGQNYVHGGNDFFMALLKKIEDETSEIVDPQWKSVVRNVFYHYVKWGSGKEALDEALLEQLECTRQKLAEHHLAWSEDLYGNFPKRVRSRLYTNDSSVMAQQKLVRKIERHFSRFNFSLFDSVPAAQEFLRGLKDYTLEEQTNPSGVLHSTVRSLVNQSNKRCLPVVLQALQEYGWTKDKLGAIFYPETLRRQCAERNFEYLEIFSSVASPKLRRLIFTWCVEDIVHKLYASTPENILKDVQTLLGSSYAFPSVQPMGVLDLRNYTNCVIQTWSRSKEVQKKHGGDRYAGSGLNATSCEEFLQYNSAHFFHPCLKDAVKLLKSLKSAQVQGTLEFWGRLHNIDYQIDGPYEFVLQKNYGKAGDQNGDVHLWAKAQDVAQRIVLANAGSLHKKQTPLGSRKI